MHFLLSCGCHVHQWGSTIGVCGSATLQSILSSLQTVDTPELDASSDEADVILSSVSSGFLCLFSTISDTSRLQLAPSIKSHKLLFQARAFLLPVSQVGKISASKLINHFSSHPAAFGFQASLPPDNITLKPANKMNDQNVSDLKTGMVAADHATLDTEKLIYHTRPVLVDTVAFLQGSGDEGIAVSKVHELLIMLHDILDCAVSIWVGYMACILAFFSIFLFNSTSRQCHVF